jgi:transposase
VLDSIDRLRKAPEGEGRNPISARDVVREIRKATRRKFSHEEKIRIVLEGLRGEIPVSDLCRREGIAPTMYRRGF